MNTLAHFLWIGPRLGTMEQLCLRSFRDHGYDVRLHTYASVDGVPAGVRVEPADAIIPSAEVFRNQGDFATGSFSGFSDLFRYEVVHRLGGWWFDLDFVSIRPLPTPDDLWIASSFENEWGDCANACALHAPPGHPAVDWLRKQARLRLAAGPLHFGAIGPFLVQQLVREQNLEKHVAPWWEFSPYPWRQIQRVALPSFRSLVTDRLRLARFLYWQLNRSDFRAGYLRRGTRAIHLHNEIWRSAGLDKDAHYHPFCLYEQLKRRHPLHP